MTIYLPYRGQIKGLVSHESHAAFITAHNEKQATALYRLDTSKEVVCLQTEPLPSGATALVLDGKTLWLVTQTGRLYQALLAKGKPRAIAKLDFSESTVIGLALLANHHLAVLQHKQLSVVDLKAKQVKQTILFNHNINTLASSPDGLYLALGDQKGVISVYQVDEQNQQLSQSSVGQVHEGAVNVIQFEANELRFYSAGSDKKLLSTHAQGELQPLNKGLNSNHTGDISAIFLGNDRFFTGANDKSIKAWPYKGGQPVTLKQGLRKITALSTILYQDKACLLVASTDNSLRLVSLTPEEKLSNVEVVIEDGYALAKYQLASKQAIDREQALDFLAAYDDKQAHDIIDKRIGIEKDRATREKMVTLLGFAKHAQSTRSLEKLLADKNNEKVRQKALEGLLKRSEKNDFRAYEKALQTQLIDISSIALKALAKVAVKEVRAQQLLIGGVNHSQSSMRLLTLGLLENVYEKKSPKASMLAFQSDYNDLKQAALVRLFQRGLLDDNEVKQVLLLVQENSDAALRHTAFLVSVLSQPTLTKVLKARDADLSRQLQELEDFDLLSGKTTSKKLTNQPDKKNNLSALQLGKTKLVHALQSVVAKKITDSDLDVLLQGMVNRYADICFMATFALAVLQDQRAFGVLLSLSQENDVGIRAGVARAFEWLEQEDSIQSLEVMLDDNESIVRDAAFSALLAVQKNTLETVRYGLKSKHQDIHSRALKTLLDNFTDKQSKASKKEALIVLKQALNDSFDGIRKEVFKACINRSLVGNETETLKVLLASEFENIHQEVLNELMAKSALLPVLEWVEPLLLSLLEDRFNGVRLAAFKWLTEEKKRFDRHVLLAAAVNSVFVDIRRAAFQLIGQKPSQENQLHLHTLLNDEDTRLRNDALSILVTNDNRQILLSALTSQYDDIKINTACALAVWGEIKSFDVLNDFLTHNEPTTSYDKKHWQPIALKAMTGLGVLGDERAFDTLLLFIDKKTTDTQQKVLADHAATYLPWVSNDKHTEILSQLQKDERDKVANMACFSLALLGSQSVSMSRFSQAKSMTKHVNQHFYLAAHLTLSPVTPLTLLPYLNNSTIKLSAFITLASHELLLNSEAPSLMTWSLSLAHAELKLFSAGLVSCYSDKKQRWIYVKHWIEKAQREAGYEQWTISEKTVQTIAAILVYGKGHLKAQLLHVLHYLDKTVSSKEWNLHYNALVERNEESIKALIKPLTTLKVPDTNNQLSWNQKAFGAYLGLIRQDKQAGYNNQQLMSLRLSALYGMRQLAEQGEALYDTVIRCLLTLLNHQKSRIRAAVFSDLKHLKVDIEHLGKTAVSLPHQDMAEQGLALLIEHYPAKKSQLLLQELMKGSHLILAVEAYHLLYQRVGLYKTAPLALEAYFVEPRTLCVKALAEQFDDKKAILLLIEASRNNHVPTAILAANHLAKQQHKQALPLLKELLDYNQDADQQEQIVRALKRLSDVKVADYLFDYWINNQLNRLSADSLYRVIASYRHIKLFKPLLDRLTTHPKESTLIIKTLVTITGYDQRIDDYKAEQADQSWLKKQFPRHDELLISLLPALIKGDYNQDLKRLKKGLSWMQDSSVDQVLIDSIPVISEPYLLNLISIITYRAERRNGSVKGLLKVLDHQNNDVQFIAAEGLANNEYHQGFGVLLAAIDYQENDDYRRRAVLALGQSADQRALDKLLALAKDKEHALKEVAIEAIGHMANHKQASKIFKLIKLSLANADTYSNQIQYALNGLRYFNTLEAWQLIADFCQNTNHYWSNRQHAADLLQYWDTEFSRTVLLNVLQKEGDEDIVETALNSAKQLYKLNADEVNEVDYALLQGQHAYLDDTLLERISQYASSAQLIVLLEGPFSSTDDDELSCIVQQLGNSLLTRSDYTHADISRALASNNLEVITVIASLVMRMPKLVKTLQTHLSETIERYYQQWTIQRLRLLGDSNWSLKEKQQLTKKALLALLWAGVCHNVWSNRSLLLLANSELGMEKSHHVFQQHLLKALLAQEKITNTEVKACLSQLLHSSQPEVSHLAHQLMASEQQKKVLDWDHFISQPSKLMESQFTKPLQMAASDSASQAQVLPVLISKQDVNTLLVIANDDNQQEHLRMGAIEGLARILNDKAQQSLQQLHKTLDDKDLSKVAYRALRRQERSQLKAARINQLSGADRNYLGA